MKFPMFDGEIEFEEPPEGGKVALMVDGPVNGALIAVKEDASLFSHPTNQHLPDGRSYAGVAYYGVSKWEPDVFYFTHFLPHRPETEEE